MAESKSAALPLGDAPKALQALAGPRSGATIVRGLAHRNTPLANVLCSGKRRICGAGVVLRGLTAPIRQPILGAPAPEQGGA